MKINSCKYWSKATAAVMTTAFAYPASGYEQSVKCRQVFEPDPFAYRYESRVIVGNVGGGRSGGCWEGSSLGVGTHWYDPGVLQFAGLLH